PHGKRFGILVHAILASAPLDASDEAVHIAARAEGRLLGASVEEIEAASLAAMAALAHPLLARARSADACRRESPIVLRLDDGSLLEGVLDLAFRERKDGAASWCVVDFKTDVEIAARSAEYEVQVTAYAAAVRAATGEPVSGYLLSV